MCRRITLGAILAVAGVALALAASEEARKAEVPPFGQGLLISTPVAATGTTSATGTDAAAAVAPTSSTAATGPAPTPTSSAGATAPTPTAAGRTSPAQTEAPGAESRVDLAPEAATLSPVAVEAVRAAMDGLDAGPWLPLRLEKAAIVPPAEAGGFLHNLAQTFSSDARGMPHNLILAITSDADADRLLDPLVPARPAAAPRTAVYLATPVAPAQVSSTFDLAPLSAEVRYERLSPVPRCLAGIAGLYEMVLVRASAVPRLRSPQAGPPAAGSSATEPNAIMLVLPRAGQMEDAIARLKGPAAKHRLLPLVIDLAVPSGSAARLLGVAALALILAGGSILAATGLIAAGQVARLSSPQGERAGRPLAEWLLGGPRLLRQHGPAFAAVLAVTMAAIAVGAAWGGPPGLGDLLRQTVAVPSGAEPLAAAGATSARLGSTSLLNVFAMTFLVSLVLWALLVMSVANIVPGLGLLACLIHNLAWGVILAPATLTLLDRLPLRAVVAVLAGLAYAMVAFASVRVLTGFLKPQALGQDTRRKGYGAGMDELYRVLPAVAAVLLVSALVETGLLAALSYVR